MELRLRLLRKTLSILLILLIESVYSNVLSTCVFIRELRKAQVPEKDWANWLCAAREKSKMNSSWVGRSAGIAPGCSRKAYGIFQIESEYCEDDGHTPECQRNPCEIRCNYLVHTGHDIQDDIKCVQRLIVSRNYNSTFYGTCFNTIATGFHECEGGTETTGTGGSVVTSVVVSLLGVSVLLIAVFFLIWWKRRGNESGLSYKEISQFKRGYTYGAVRNKRSTQAIMMEQLQREDNINGSPYESSLEIPHTDYEIYADEILGSGAYGVVVKGSVRNEVVAVKTVKPFSNKDFVLSLLEEIKVMTYLGRHDNILGLIGANTTLLRRGIVYVFVELCPLGSLEKYLKGNRSSFVDLIKNDEFTSEKSRAEEDGEGMSSATLLIWAHQISNAMQFLASKNVIHGDLATRNVLLRSKHLVKISDFGLSRKMYEYCNYIKQKQEPLPWRHMSLEALRNMEFSTKSDVWAFGVTLWEIFTLGDLPYPGMSYTLGFLEDLQGGLRMPKPKYATTELYQKAMQQTWNESPRDRPSFEDLSVFLRDALERVCFHQEYINVNDYTN